MPLLKERFVPAHPLWVRMVGPHIRVGRMQVLETGRLGTAPGLFAASVYIYDYNVGIKTPTSQGMKVGRECMSQES